ncbi:UDP-Glycosyltransferase/glycogen phosphorylase [Lenzites betulinus]|nr:UDP-Glycosyltransferase/glycogen phosphorylase [Lenzites betulinus]
MSTAQKHIVAFPHRAWGHTRPLINLSARLVKLHDINVTFIVTDTSYDRTVSELGRNFTAGEEAYAKRVRVVSAGAVELWDFSSLDAFYNNLWLQLVAGEEVVCKKTGTRFDPLPKPDAVIIDCLAVQLIRSIKKLSGTDVKMYSWASASTYVLFHVFGPKQYGGRGSFIKDIEAEAQRTGRPLDDIAVEVLRPTGKVIESPGLPPMYDFEYHPQALPVPKALVGALFPHVFDSLEACDGVLLNTTEPYEHEAVAAVRKWYAETGRPVYVCGPLVPPQSANATANEKQQSNDSDSIQVFLDSTLETSGEKSLLYIAFGSVYWPPKAENIWAFLDVVMELNIPFILSHSSPMAVIPEEVKEKVKAYGKGVLSLWSPQQTILQHPATGCFVTHGGHGSVIESICARVPLIFWPFAHDQPTSAVHTTDTLQVGYELIEVRTGPAGLHKIYRSGRTPKGTIETIKEEARDVLTKAYGEDGAEKRKRLAALSQAITHEWEEGGASLRDMKAFLESL